MKQKKLILLTLVAFGLFMLPVLPEAWAVSGAAFTTYNPWVDGEFKDVCKNSQINCNIYGSKPDVWLNGGPAANGLGPDGEYFFSVLVPGGQPDPNDGGAKNLSDDFDSFMNRTFTVTNGEVSFYGGTHDQDSGNTLNAGRATCSSPRGCAPDGNPPFIRLFPYADTWNPGGVYILAICSLEDGYPVDPKDCKYDAFKVKQGRIDYDLLLMGRKYKDFLPDGPGGHDRGISGIEIIISGTGFAGETIDAVVTTGTDGFWEYSVDYTFDHNDPVQDAVLTVCEVLPEPFYQTYPADGGCYEAIVVPASMGSVSGLDFGNWLDGLPRR